MLELYVIEFENAHWCGAPEYCVVWAESEEDALIRASDYMEEVQRDLYSGEYADAVEEGEDYDDESAVGLTKVTLLAESSHAEFYAQPEQRAHFYPCVNESEAP